MMQTGVRQIGAMVGSLLKRQLPTTVGLDIGSGNIKFAELSWNQGNTVITAAGIEPLPANAVRDGYILDNEKMADALRRVWGMQGIKGKYVVLALRGQAVLVRELLLPCMNNKELKQVIKWELNKYIPISDAADYYFDFAVLGPAEDAQNIRVLLVAAPLEMINGIIRAVKEAGLKPVAFDIEPLALQRTMEKADNAIIIDIGAECCQLNLFQQGSPLVSRFIPLSGGRFTEIVMQTLETDFFEAEKFKMNQAVLLPKQYPVKEPVTAIHQNMLLLVGELAREISRTTDYYQLQNRNAIIDKIVLTGGGAQLNYLAENLAELLAGIEVIVHSPSSLLQISPSLNLEQLKAIELQLAVAIGLALRGSDE